MRRQISEGANRRIHASGSAALNASAPGAKPTPCVQTCGVSGLVAAAREYQAAPMHAFRMPGSKITAFANQSNSEGARGGVEPD
jgi:hypothetical protein